LQNAYNEQRTLLEANSARAKQLEASQARFQRLYEGQMDGFLLLDEKGLIQQSNAAVRHMLGYGKDEIDGLPYHTIAPPTEYDTVEQSALEQMHEQEHSELFERTLIHKDGHQVPVEMRRYACHEESDLLSRTWLVLHDVT
jgi:PAS domain S-box-containing protein